MPTEGTERWTIWKWDDGRCGVIGPPTTDRIPDGVTGVAAALATEYEVVPASQLQEAERRAEADREELTMIALALKNAGIEDTPERGVELAITDLYQLKGWNRENKAEAEKAWLRVEAVEQKATELQGALERIADKCWQHPNDEPATKTQLEDALYAAHQLAITALSEQPPEDKRG